ncbi:glycoside hydrolase family 16 protein [Amanita rubescens]|nr:glycoside hydrolase family 16 protein [Amanita rubescens]
MNPNPVFKGSAAASLNVVSGDSGTLIPRPSSAQTFRPPFLSPASRPSSSVWSPPTYPLVGTNPSSPSGSFAALPYALPKSKPPLPSTRIAAPIPISDKPWLSKKEPRATLSYFITIICMLLGLGGAAVLCWQGFTSVQKLDPNRLCLVLDENFDGTSLDNSVWSYDVELGGFGNGEFQMTTNSPNNLFLQDSELYIYPTLTSDTVPNVLNGGNYTLSGCTTSNRTACTVTSSAAAGTVINPVMSARISTRGKKNITYGKIEFRAKFPTGQVSRDWLWPAVWMLPEKNIYGSWPSSGEIDIIEARGNGPSYPAQGSNFVRSSLNYGPLPTILNQIYGWYSLKRSSFDQGFHVYGFEWDQDFMRFYTDSRLNAMLNIRISGKGNSFWQRGGFPETAQNGSAKAVVNDPWENRGPSAPFDQAFYLIIDLAAGGTSGWFPDNVGGKPWYDGSLTAMREFAQAQNVWAATWPTSQNKRSFRIDYVKMWQLC